MTQEMYSCQSNRAQCDADAITGLLNETVDLPDEPEHSPAPKWQSNCDITVEDDTILIDGVDGMFTVREFDHGDDITRDFLTSLALHLDEILIIRSVAFDPDNTYPPSAEQWEVMPGGTVNYRRLPSTQDFD